LAVLALALAFRLPQLDLRPMHGDEAIGAMRAMQVLETGHAEPQPRIYHGPLLAWATYPVLKAAGARIYADLDPWMVRIVPALCGAGAALAPFLLADGLGVGAAAIAGGFIAVSPAFVYWSRDYIPEMLLVFLGALAIGLVGGGRARVLAGAVCAGLMIATKETAWLMFGAGAVAAFAVPESRSWLRRHGPRLVGPALLALVVAAILLGGPGMLVAPFKFYPGLAASGGDHAHPWTFYLGLVSFGRSVEGGLIWSEGAILVLACLGGWTGRSRPVVRFLGVYTLVLAAAYAVIPYKTPWCLLGFWWGAAVLAGVGVVEEWAALRRAPGRRAAWAACVALAIVHLGWQAWRASFVWPADRRNPYVYAQAVGDVVRLGALVERLAAAHADGRAMVVAVVAPDPWPLPWYLRRMTSVGYWTAAGDAAAREAIRLAPVVIAAPGLVHPPGDRVVQHYGTRPGVVVELSVRRSLWERALR
jgi:hypothetical protein